MSDDIKKVSRKILLVKVIIGLFVVFPILVFIFENRIFGIVFGVQSFVEHEATMGLQQTLEIFRSSGVALITLLVASVVISVYIGRFLQKIKSNKK